MDRSSEWPSQVLGWNVHLLEAKGVGRGPLGLGSPLLRSPQPVVIASSLVKASLPVVHVYPASLRKDLGCDYLAWRAQGLTLIDDVPGRFALPWTATPPMLA